MMLTELTRRILFNEILKLGAVPIVNENDTVSTYEIEQLQAFGDNDRLSAIVASINRSGPSYSVI